MYSLREALQYIDELTKTDLQHLRDWYFLWLLISSGVVALGVILEGPEVVHEISAMFRRTSLAETKKPRWITWLGLAGWFFVVLGVAGEGIAEALVSKADGLVQTFNDILLTDAQRDIARTEEHAGEAKVSAVNAADAADRANKSAQQANGEAESAKQRVGEVVKEAAELRKQNLDLAQKLASIEKAAFPRSLRQREFAAKLKLIKGSPVIIETIADFEAQRTAALIQAGMRMAEWQVGPLQVFGNPPLQNFFFPGVQVEDNCGTDLTLDWHSTAAKKDDELWRICYTASESLVKELNENGIEARGPRPADDMPRNTIRVRVSFKPMPGEPATNLASFP
jgi:hypothetical protein